MAKLRGYVFLDRLQPQLMSLLGATCRGYLPRANDASLTVEVAPGMDVEWLTDVALKHDDVKAGGAGCRAAIRLSRVSLEVRRIGAICRRGVA